MDYRRVARSTFMTKKLKILIDLNRVNWSAIGDSVCSVLATVKGSRVRFEREASQRGTNLEGLVAAAITEMIRERLEAESAKQLGDTKLGSDDTGEE
jgi:phage baseplate assembly protein W